MSVPLIDYRKIKQQIIILVLKPVPYYENTTESIIIKTKRNLFDCKILLTSTSMYFRFEYAPKNPKPANTKMTTPIIIRIMDRVVTSLTAWMHSRRDLIWSVLISDTFLKVRLPTVINPNPMNCQREHVWFTC